MIELLLVYACAFMVGLVLVFMFSQFLFTKQDAKNIPPGNMGWPLLGESLSFLKPHEPNTIGSFLQNHCSRYGRVFRSNLFGSPTIVSCDYELNMFILQNEEKLFQCSYPKIIRNMLGNLSLLVAVGDVHKTLRSVALSFTSTCKAKSDYLYNIDKLATSTMESWKDRKEVIFFGEAKKFIFNLLVKQILNVEPEEPLASTILDECLTFMKGLVALPIYIPGTTYAKAVNARARIVSIIIAIMEERRNGDLGMKEDFLDALLSNTSSSDEGKVSVVLDLLLAGYETTSILMSMVVYFLGQSPYALNKLKEEHETIKERKAGEPLSWEDYKQMEFTHYVINEGLRCGNVVKFLPRKALQDVDFKGYLIPSGWTVLPVFTAVHLDPSLHKNASEFNPLRWTGQATHKHFQPFGGGSRLCPGAELARVKIALFLHHLVLNYRWRTKEVDHPVAYPFVKFKRGLPIQIELWT